MEMHSFGENLRRSRQRKGLSMAELAERVGTSRQTVHRYESGAITNIPPERVERLAAELDVSPSVLYGWQEEGVPSECMPLSGMHPIPFLGDIACGEPRIASGEQGAYIMADDGIHADFCLRAAGDSMEDARIRDGDIVFVRRQSMVGEGEIAAVVIDDEATLKRVYYNREENRLILMPANPRYAPIIYTGEELDHVRILGRAVAFQSAL